MAGTTTEAEATEETEEAGEAEETEAEEWIEGTEGIEAAEVEEGEEDKEEDGVMTDNRLKDHREVSIEEEAKSDMMNHFQLLRKLQMSDSYRRLR